MIKKSIYIVLLSFLMVSCGSSKNVSYKKTKNTTRKVNQFTKSPTIADKILWTAVSYKGTRYKYGGTTKSGMDCSGLIYTSFKKRDVTIPRTSREMYKKGTVISLKKVRRGDLLFFKTAGKLGRVNHVGLVTSTNDSNIKFIHSTSSRGVIVTSLFENYWKRAFLKAKRIL